MIDHNDMSRIAPIVEPPQLSALLDKLESIRPHSCRFVGGCVREALLGRRSDDIDLAVCLSPGRIAAAAEQLGLRVLRHGLEHGVVMTRCNGVSVEAACLRRDAQTDGRHARTIRIDDWSQDASRRDFRCNAVYADRNGKIFDPLGGVSDIKSRKVVFIGDADMRIREDFLRILRFFRFSACYADRIDANGVAAISRRLDGLRRLSGERISSEMMKLLAAQRPETAVRAMVGCGALAAVLGCKAFNLGRMERMIAADRQYGYAPDAHYGYAPDAHLRLAALLPADAVEAVARRLRLSGVETKRIVAASALPAVVTAKAARLEIYRYGADAWRDKLRMAHAATGNDRIPTLMALADKWQAPVFPLSGKDALNAGLVEGPQTGIVLERLRNYWLEDDFAPSREQLLQRLRRMIKELPPSART